MIKYVPDESVVKQQIGKSIKLTAPEFELLSSAFFAELERRFLQTMTRLFVRSTSQRRERREEQR